MKFLLRLLVCLGVLGSCLYSYLNQQNELTEVRIAIPQLMKEIKTIKEDNMRLKYEIDQFESPEHLMELARHSEYNHLKHPLAKEILSVRQGVALKEISDEKNILSSPASQPALASGALH